HIRGTPGRTAFGDECLARRLHVARLVCRPALQDHRPPIPAPRHAEAGERLAQNRRLQCRLRPAPTTVGRDFDFTDAAISGKGDAGNLEEAGLLNVQSRRRMGDEGFYLLREVELPGFSVWSQDGVLLSFV